jgi:AcrR family transcriptional regulator
MIMDVQKQECIKMLIEGTLTRSAISNKLNISRTTIYNWLKDEEFVAELARREQDIKNFGNKQITARLDTAIEELWELRNTTTNEKVKEGIYTYFIDRALGKATSRLDIDASVKDAKRIDVDVLEQEMDEWEVEGEEK